MWGGGWGCKKRGRGQVKFSPHRKWGGNFVTILKGGRGGGDRTSFEVSLIGGHLSFSHAEGGGGAKGFHPIKGGHEKLYPVLRRGRGTISDPRFSHFVAPLPVINDRSLWDEETGSTSPPGKRLLVLIYTGFTC